MMFLYYIYIYFFLPTDNFRNVNGPEFVRIYIFQMAIGVIEIGLAIITTVIVIPIINKGPTSNQFPNNLQLGYPVMELERLGTRDQFNQC